MAADPRLDTVFQEVFASRQGQQLALKRPQVYGLHTGQRLRWGQVAEVVRQCDDTLLGVVVAGGEPQLALDWQQRVVLRAGDTLVVLTRW